jgi:hypothetical protein
MTKRLQLSTMIFPQWAELIQNDLDPKTMVEYKSRLDWNQWKEAIQAEIA